MAIHIRENQYKGVNAHLNSYLQNEPGGWWEVFHSNHLAHIRDAVDAQLPPGYYALNEKSLQVEIAETIDEEDYLTSVVIVQGDSTRNIKPVTRIELLSPSNKPPNSNSHFYITRRNETLISGINLVEIDYLHQSSSPIWILPSYPKREAKSYPYMILVSNPHPTLVEGVMEIFSFRVEDSIPLINIPLLGEDKITFDFGEVYNRTFRLNRYFYEVADDYEQKPMNFESYDDEDQRRIEALMRSIADAYQDK